MMRMREHIYRLHGSNLILGIEQLEIAGLCSRVTAYVHNAARLCKEQHIDYIVMHSGTWRVGNDDIRTAMLVDEILRKDVLHIAGLEQGILDTVDLRIDLCILNSLGHILDTHYLAGTAGYEVGNGTCSGIKVVHQFVSCKTGKVACYLI